MNITGLLGLVTTPTWRQRIGDIATPTLVVEDLIKQLGDPVALLQSGEFIIDPCCGHASILVYIASQAKQVMPPKQIAKQLWGYDIRHGSTAKRLVANELGIDPKYVNIYEEDSLKADIDMKKFNVVMNPPFNEEPGDDRDTAGNSNNSILYQEFVNKFAGVAKQVVSLNPAGWTIKSKDVDRYKKIGLKHVQFLPASHFPSVSIRSGLTISKFERGYNGDITVTTINNETYTQPRADTIKNITPITKSILQKLGTYADLGKLIKTGTVLMPRGTKGNSSRAVEIDPTLFQSTKTEGFPHKMLAFIGGANRDMTWLWCSKPCEYTNTYKAVVSGATSKYLLGAVIVVEPGIGICKNNMLFETATKREAELYKAYLDSKLVRYIVQNNKFNDVVNTKTNTWNHIPQPPMDKLLKQKPGFDIDIFLYAEFKLTQREQDYVEQNFK